MAKNEVQKDLKNNEPIAESRITTSEDVPKSNFLSAAVLIDRIFTNDILSFPDFRTTGTGYLGSHQGE